MGHEIERKFLPRNDQWRGRGDAIEIRQGYLHTEPGRSVRVRIAGPQAFLTIKGPVRGASRLEFEYGIPLRDASELMRLCTGSIIEKTRHRIPVGNLVWEVDEFAGENAGLILMEVELESENQAVDLPGWVGREVTGDPRFFNGALSRHPFRRWDRD